MNIHECLRYQILNSLVIIRAVAAGGQLVFVKGSYTRITDAQSKSDYTIGNLINLGVVFFYLNMKSMHQ